ncbi:unnamed protein product [Rhizoctonia solani]|uniref:Uncharacterized protein n=1 Tax=Rhizoctonia solani TaxID=456999 RepID=A0A8H3AM35_9AGAM|nr:unnamed protein product [Rhizoctonia solani]
MSADSLEVQISTHDKFIQENKVLYGRLLPQIGDASEHNHQEEQAKPPGHCSELYQNPFKRPRRLTPLPEPSRNRIHSHNLPKQSTCPVTPPVLFPTSTEKENHHPILGMTRNNLSCANRGVKPQSVGSFYTSSPSKTSNQQDGRGPLSVKFSNDTTTYTKPMRPVLVASSSIPAHHDKRRPGVYKMEDKANAHNISIKHQVHGNNIPRCAQGHKSTSRLRFARHTSQKVTTEQNFDCCRREVNATVSTLGSRVGALENTLAAVLPAVVEARLIWMENAVVSTPTKLGTTRRAFCEYYKNSRYETYTRCIRARAYYLGLTVNDLEYLQERLVLLGSQSVKQETLLISPFGGANESSDKTMVEAYHRDSRHGGYARHVWRACYERGYSLDESWMLPIPSPDSSTFVDKIKGWLHAS